jgi:hypothetical protein
MDNELIDDLKSDDAEVRASAREELLAEMNDEIAEEFLAIAESGASEDVRADVVIGLGPIMEECGDDYDENGASVFSDEEGPALSFEKFQDAKKRLRALYDDQSQPQLVRRRALETLVRDPQSWHRDEIEKLASSGDLDWKRTAVFCMGYFAGFESTILATLDDSNQDLVFEAVRAAGSQELKEAADKISEFAASAADRDVRLESILALPYVKRDSIDQLESLADSDDDEIAEAAEAALDDLSMLQGEDMYDEEEVDE